MCVPRPPARWASGKWRSRVEPLVKRLKDGEPSVRLQAVIALGRIGRRRGDSGPVAAGRGSGHFSGLFGPAALRRIGDWPVAAQGLDSPDARVRAGTLLAMDQVYDMAAASRLADFAASTNRPAAERVRALEYAAEVARKAPPWDGKWWGTQPAKQQPPARTIAWDGTPRVMTTIRDLATDPTAPVRTAAVEAMARTNATRHARSCRGLFPREQEPGVKSAIAIALGKLADTDALDLLTAALKDAHARRARPRRGPRRGRDDRVEEGNRRTR